MCDFFNGLEVCTCRYEMWNDPEYMASENKNINKNMSCDEH